ncbi:hypothetical protein oki361_18940 [Helicobacter pylori]
MLIAVTESPPPTTEKHFLLFAIAIATPLVPFSYSENSVTPTGPFQKIVLALAISFANNSIDSGPISSPIYPSGILSFFELV